MADQALIAIGKVVLTNREHLAALDPFGRTMLLSTLYWPDEIRSAGELDLPTADAAPVRPMERAMAEQLVAAMTRVVRSGRPPRRLPRRPDGDHRREGVWPADASFPRPSPREAR